MGQNRLVFSDEGSTTDRKQTRGLQTMRRATRFAVTAVAVTALAGGLLAAGTVLGTPRGPASSESAPGRPGGAMTDPLARSIAALQQELTRVPTKDASWAELGLLYLQRARSTVDPGLYARAEGAFAQSLALRPVDNDLALTGQASLAATRHDFAEALALTDQALAANPASPTTYAVRVDALVELGRYDEAQVALDRLLDLRPGTDAYSRASYLFELRGDGERAREAMQAAYDEATNGPDRSFASYFLGELAWNAGDLDAAVIAYDQAVLEDPSSVPPLAGRAKVAAARGDVAGAVTGYRTAIDQLPLPYLLIELGELLESTGDLRGAEEQYAVVRATQRLYAEGGQDVDTELALFEADHGSPDAAIASAERAYRKRPDSVLTQDAYAWALHAAGRDAEALPIARAAARTGLVRPTLQHHLGMIEAAAGDRAAAARALEAALASNPAFSPLHAPRARTALEGLG